MNRKGISPLIAAVLLIAFTMAVASLFAQWAPRLMNQAQGDTTNRTQQIQDDSTYGLDIIEANTTHATVQQTSGSDGIGDLTVTWRYTDAAPAQDTSSTISSAQGIVVSNITSADAGSNLEGVRVQSVAHENVVATYP